MILHVGPLLSILFGILILIFPRFLNYFVALYMRANRKQQEPDDALLQPVVDAHLARIRGLVKNALGLERDGDVTVEPYDDAEFEELVRDALDELPDWAQRALERNVAVVISDGGRRRGAYGLYHGGGVARNDVADRIVIYRDTLRRDFGHDPDELRAQVVRTVRHELAHHLGWNELGVRDLGL